MKLASPTRTIIRYLSPRNNKYTFAPRKEANPKRKSNHYYIVGEVTLGENDRYNSHLTMSSRHLQIEASIHLNPNYGKEKEKKNPAAATRGEPSAPASKC